MSFGELLKKQRQKKLEMTIEQKMETFKKMGKALIYDAVQAVKASCLLAADNNESYLKGYISQYQCGEKILPTITEFEYDKTFKPYGSGVFVMCNYGTDSEFAEYIRRGLEKELLMLQFDSFEIKIEKRMFFSLSKNNSNHSKNGNMSMVRDSEKYIIHISVSW